MANSEQLDRIDPWVWRVAAVVVLGSIMSILDTTIVNVALETLHSDLHSPLADIQWVITGYLLALAVVIPISGWASRRFGAKNIYLMSIVLFTLGSALCGAKREQHDRHQVDVLGAEAARCPAADRDHDGERQQIAGY